MAEEKRIAALYDFRSKQGYIYRTNAILEIIGASNLIARAYEEFLDRLKKEGIAIHGKSGDTGNPSLKEAPLLLDLENSDYDGELLYVGGGNLYMLYRSREVAIRANQIFSRMLLETTYSLTPVCACTEYTGDYVADRKRVLKEKSRIDNMEPVTADMAYLPFTQLDRKTSLPVVEKTVEHDEELSLSRESVLKRAAGKIAQRGWGDDTNAFVLDDMTEKGKDSLLAVIYIDGNGMGERIKNMFVDNRTTDYPSCVSIMRNFSAGVQTNYVDTPIAAIETLAKTEHQKFRRIIGGGDEITLICKAKFALKIVETYFNALTQTKSTEKNTACAGIAIFHSHDPFSIVYEIAEQCCESAKKKNRSDGGDNCLLDFYVCHSGITNNMETLRKRVDGHRTRRPYYILGETETKAGKLSGFVRVGEALKGLGRPRAKGLCEQAAESEAAFRTELARLKTYSECDGLKIDCEDIGYVYDAGQVMDLWFHEEVQEDAAASNPEI